MAKPKAKESQRFWRVAVQHIGDAQMLFRNGSKTGAATYLAGYAIECGLKALLLANCPPSKVKELLLSFTGSKAHDFDWLRQQLRQRQIEVATHMLEHLRKVGSWSVALRYDPTEWDPRDTEVFLASTVAILDWVKG